MSNKAKLVASVIVTFIGVIIFATGAGGIAIQYQEYGLSSLGLQIGLLLLGLPMQIFGLVLYFRSGRNLNLENVQPKVVLPFSLAEDKARDPDFVKKYWAFRIKWLMICAPFSVLCATAGLIAFVLNISAWWVLFGILVFVVVWADIARRRRKRKNIIIKEEIEKEKSP